MSKKEAVWRDILAQYRTQKRTIFTQKECAANFGISTSTVFNAIKPLREAGIIQVSGLNFRLDSYKKLLLFWASHRAFQKDIFYRAYVNLDPKAIEAVMPPSVRFGLYSAFAFAYHFTPAEYDHIYVYADQDEVGAIEERLSGMDKKNKHANKYPNFFALKTDPWLIPHHPMPLEQLFADIWNAPEWYAKDFLKYIEEQLPFGYE
jgi:DNA-binding Lrp family transcriptional regulator